MGITYSKPNKLGVNSESASGFYSSVHNKFDSSNKESSIDEQKNYGPDSSLFSPNKSVFENSEDLYDMTHARRGMAIIFNHRRYVPQLGLNERKGTDKDKENLIDILDELGFETQVHEDLGYRDIIRVIQRLSSETDHKDADCILVVVLTHGEEGTLYAHDHPYQSEKIWEPFNDIRCPSLSGKPKIFFIQSCRGEEFDPGITLTKKFVNTQHDSIPLEYKMTNCPDYLVVYSTVEGFYSWRNTRHGSWFIQSLCQNLSKYYKNGRDILSCMTATARQVAMNFESGVPKVPAMHEKKQVPCVNSTLTKEIIFCTR